METKGIRHAGFWVRFAANLLDTIIMGIPILVILMFSFKSRADQDLINLLIYTAATIFLWTSWDGRTPGKKIMGIKIVSYPEYGPISLRKALVRFLIGYTISGLLFFIGYIMVAFRKDKRGLHDLIAGTCVVHY